MSEIETAILILSSDNSLIIEKIKKLISIHGYKATEAGTVIINDEYFDIQDNVLKKMKPIYGSELQIMKTSRLH